MACQEVKLLNRVVAINKDSPNEKQRPFIQSLLEQRSPPFSLALGRDQKSGREMGKL